MQSFIINVILQITATLAALVQNYPPNPLNLCYYSSSNNYSAPICPTTAPLAKQDAVPQPRLEPKIIEDTNKTTKRPKPAPTLQIDQISKPEKDKKSPIDTVINQNPELGNKIRKIFEYNGIMPPWDPLKDLSDLSHQRLPNPNMLYTKMKDILKVFESLKEMISDELLKIETYVKRDKFYLKEYQERLERNLERMKKYMGKIKKTSSEAVKSEYIRKFNEIHSETRETVVCYQKLKKWLMEILSYFKVLF